MARQRNAEAEPVEPVAPPPTSIETNPAVEGQAPAPYEPAGAEVAEQAAEAKKREPKQTVSVTYRPTDPAEARVVQWGGFTFEAGKPVQVPIKGRYHIIRKARDNPYFEVKGDLPDDIDDVPKRAPKVAPRPSRA